MDVEEPELVPKKEAYANVPEMLLKFYECQIPWSNNEYETVD